MIRRRDVLRGLAGAALVGAAGRLGGFVGAAEEPKKKTGTVVGVLTEKGENFIVVKADGEENGRRYVPRWIGGAPAKGGGLDKTMLKTIRSLKVGSRVRLEWEFEERARVVKIEVLKASE